MKTAVDTNILLGALSDVDEEARIAKDAILRAVAQGELTASAVCYAEVARRFQDKKELDQFFVALQCNVSAIDSDTAFLAGRYFEDYRKRGGEKLRILADFLIAADAVLHADRILTHDKRFFGTQFPGLAAVSYDDL